MEIKEISIMTSLRPELNFHKNFVDGNMNRFLARCLFLVVMKIPFEKAINIITTNSGSKSNPEDCHTRRQLIAQIYKYNRFMKGITITIKTAVHFIAAHPPPIMIRIIQINLAACCLLLATAAAFNLKRRRKYLTVPIPVLCVHYWSPARSQLLADDIHGQPDQPSQQTPTS